MVSKCMKKAQLFELVNSQAFQAFDFISFDMKYFITSYFLHHQNLTKMQFGFRDTCAYCNSYMSHKLLIDNGILRSV